VGGGILVLGSLLAAVPGRRRRPTDPLSAPLPVMADGTGPGHDGDGPHDQHGHDEDSPVLVGTADDRVPVRSP
jgi:hypothetical protein